MLSTLVRGVQEQVSAQKTGTYLDPLVVSLIILEDGTDFVDSDHMSESALCFLV